MNQKYLRLSNIGSYNISFNLSNYVWEIVLGWEYFEKKTVGMQFTRAIDSISANIAEGFGRYHKKDKMKFYRYSLGSTKEALDWNEKSRVRGLIDIEQYDYIYQELQLLPREISSLINFTNKKLAI